jgi:site-specific DNA-cytosine methylase
VKTRTDGGHSVYLRDQVADPEWGTPNAHERTHSPRDVDHGIQLANQVKGSLNPAWVEALMGFPAGWTDPDCETPTDYPGFPAPPGPQYDWEPPRTTSGRDRNRRPRLAALGNAVVPQLAELIGRGLR